MTPSSRAIKPLPIPVGFPSRSIEATTTTAGLFTLNIFSASPRQGEGIMRITKIILKNKVLIVKG
jgi:hypothetical protein